MAEEEGGKNNIRRKVMVTTTCGNSLVPCCRLNIIIELSFDIL